MSFSPYWNAIKSHRATNIKYILYQQKQQLHPNIAPPPPFIWTAVYCVLHFIFFLLCFLDPEEHPQNEEYWGHVNPIGPRACYDEGKRVAETMCYAYMKQVSPFMYM